MSRTYRRRNYNVKTHIYLHYWTIFSEQELKNVLYIRAWKYHSDNYYTKQAKKRKQFFKNKEYRKIRRALKEDIQKNINIDLDLIAIDNNKRKSIRHLVH